MGNPKPSIPTPREQQALNFLHQHGSATVREYFEQGEAVQGNAYTSVMTLLDTMFKKGQVTRTVDGRAFRYKPAMPQVENRAAVIENVLENVFGGDLNAFKTAVSGLKARKKK